MATDDAVSLADIRIPPKLKTLLFDAGVGPTRSTTYVEFISVAIREYLPQVHDRFGNRTQERPKRNQFAEFRVKLSANLHDEVVNLCDKRSELVEAQRQSAPATGAREERIKFHSQRSAYEEIISRRLACEHKDFGLTGQEDRVQAITGYDPRDSELAQRLRRSNDARLGAKPHTRREGSKDSVDAEQEKHAVEEKKPKGLPNRRPKKRA